MLKYNEKYLEYQNIFLIFAPISIIQDQTNIFIYFSVKRFLIYKVVAPSGVMNWIESSSGKLAFNWCYQAKASGLPSGRTNFINPFFIF